MYCVYALKSLRDGKYYFGQSNNPIKRVALHNHGKVRSTMHRRPLALMGYKVFETRNEARWYEYNLKRHGDRKKKFLLELLEKRPPARRAYGPEGGDEVV